ncbi:aromatic amino acid ammonia-lyase [Nonomuraea lactucae]|uniref:aromatic amino acid ammonia-lyase n=1 Tax=Nonomuraea lactucae TaxID=2249762 RepID=UPI000DE1EBF3|nr:aromatic amino acid ammonia-lyase [Nonomuraea lactucae]
MASRAIVLDGARVGPADIAGLARRPGTAVRLDPGGLERAAAAHLSVKAIVTRRPVYGRNTGVGANRTEDVAAADSDTHGLRLLRSHAGGVGPLAPADQVRAMLAVRANQILAGGAGLQPVFAQAMAGALGSGHLPEVHEVGAIGTGDLTALAETGLTLIGERPWTDGRGEPPAPVTLESGDALAFISSGALTIGQAALAWADIAALLRATHVVTALSLLAVDGGSEPYDEEVHAARPHPGSVEVAAELRRLLGGPRQATARVQDPFGYRCFPQVHGPAVEAAALTERVLTVEINAAAENPLVRAAGGTLHHHGGFHQAALGLALDHLRVALLHTAHLSTARLATLVEPALTGLRPFLASGATASSGVMILEYSANSALADLRGLAYPAALGHAVLSRGVEEHAGFASQSARQTLRAAASYRLVLACELVSAVRALRQRGVTPDPGTPVGSAFAVASGRLDPRTEDRPLSGDVETAATLLDTLATT